MAEVITMKRSDSFSQLHFVELLALKEQNQLTDFRILCDNRAIECHRVVLAASSPMLKTMMLTKMKESTTSEVNLDCIPYDILTSVVGYLYTGEIEVKPADLKEIITACNYFILEELKDFLATSVTSLLSPVNVISWLAFSEQHQIDSLSSACKALMVSAFPEVTKQEEFLSLNLEDVRDYMTDAGGREVSTDDILDAIMGWTNDDQESRITNLKDLVKEAKLEKCDVKRLQDVMQHYDKMLDNALDVYKVLSLALVKLMNSERIKQCLVLTGGNSTRNLWILSEDKFTEMASIPEELQHAWSYMASICQAPRGLIFTDGNICRMFLIKSKSWKKLPNLRRNRQLHGSVFVDGYVIVVGGCASDNQSRSTDILSITEEDWEEGPAGPEKLVLPQVAAIGKDVFILSQNTRNLYHIVLSSPVWSRRASLPGSGELKWCSMTATQEKLFVAGGKNRLCAWYTPDTNTWCKGKPPRIDHTFVPGLTMYKNKVLLLGGCHTDVVESYDQEKDQWQDLEIKVPRKGYNLYAFVVDIEK